MAVVQFSTSMTNPFRTLPREGAARKGPAPTMHQPSAAPPYTNHQPAMPTSYNQIHIAPGGKMPQLPSGPSSRPIAQVGGAFSNQSTLVGRGGTFFANPSGLAGLPSGPSSMNKTTIPSGPRGDREL